MDAPSNLPSRIGVIRVPQDGVSAAAWAWAQRTLPTYLLAHSARSYCWGATLGADEGLEYDARILWAASLMHDVGLTRISRNTRCFEYQGGAFARAFLVRAGMAPADADVVRIAIELHMAPGVTLDDGVESVLLDRATAIDVRGDGYERIAATRSAVTGAFPRGSFDRWFVAAIRREVRVRPGCQSERLLDGSGLEASMARSPWKRDGG